MDVVQLPEAAKGRVLALHFRAKDRPDDKRAQFNLVNVYFSSGQGDMANKQLQIEALLHLEEGVKTVVGGDFNFVEAQSDCTGPMENCCLTGDAKGAWESVKTHLH